MFRSFIFIFLFLATTFLNSQTTYEWYPLQPNTEYNYRFDTSLTISSVLKTDSSKLVSGQTVYYLNKIVLPCDTCKNQSLSNDPVDSTYMLTQQPQFLGHNFRFISPDVFYFKGAGKAFTIRIHTPAGATWIYDSIAGITATTVAKSQQLVFGNADSVVTIALSSSDTLMLSKQYGMLRFSEYAVSKLKYSLVGIKGGAFYGQQQKFFADFFNYATGNIFQYEFSDDDFNLSPPLFKRGNEKWEMLNVINYPDSVVCQVKKTYFDSTWLGGNPPTITSYTQTVNISFIDSLRHFTNSYPLQEISANPYFIMPSSFNFIHRVMTGLDSKGRSVKNFGENCPNLALTGGKTGAAQQTAFPNVYINRNNGNSRRLVGREAVEGLGITSEFYDDYDRIYHRCLIGYIKGNDTSGTIYGSSVGIKEWQQDIAVSVYPNPASDYLTVENHTAQPLTLQIYSIQGQLLETTEAGAASNQKTISTRHLGNGVYLLRILAGNKKAERRLVVIHD